MEYEPLEDQCLVEVLPLPQNDLLLQPNTLLDQHAWLGKVLVAGKGYISKKGVRIPPPVNVGDTVIVPSISSNWFKLFDDRTVFVRGRDILAKVSEEDEIELPRQVSFT